MAPPVNRDALDLFSPQRVDTNSWQYQNYDINKAINESSKQIVRQRYDEAMEQFDDDWAVPHSLTFASVWGWLQKYYYSYYDESQIDNLQNSIVMRRDGFVQELLWHRQLPCICLDHTLECDDPDDPGQTLVRKELDRLHRRLPYFQKLKLQLDEHLFYGKSGTQFRWGSRKICGRDYNTIVQHLPVNGDKITFSHDHTPGIFIYRGSVNPVFEDPIAQASISYLDRGPCLFLNHPYYRDRFIISEFQSVDTDYLFEPEKALAAHGVGFRDRFYWIWNMRIQVLQWYMNAIERVGANGMLAAYFPAGNDQARIHVLKALKDFISTNVAAFPRQLGDKSSLLEKIDASPVGYDVMYQLLTHFEGIMRRGFLGQNLSSQSDATGMGSGVADLQAQSKEDVVLFDATNLAEAINDQLTQKLLKMNFWFYNNKWYRGDDLPFGIRFSFQTERTNVSVLIQAAKALWEMGIPLDMEDIRDRAGFRAPRSKATTLVQMGGGGRGVTPNQQAVRSEIGHDMERMSKELDTWRSVRESVLEDFANCHTGPDGITRVPKGSPEGGEFCGEGTTASTPGSPALAGKTTTQKEKGGGGAAAYPSPGSEPSSEEGGVIPRRPMTWNEIEAHRKEVAKARGRRWVAFRSDLPRDLQNMLTDYDIEQFKTPQQIKEFTKRYRAAVANKNGMLPTLEEVKAMSQAGVMARGQYDATARALEAMIGPELTRIWSIVNGILSAQSAWEDHSTASLVLLRYWNDAGRPTKREEIQKVFDEFWNGFTRPQMVKGKPTDKMVKAYPLFTGDKQEKVAKVLSDTSAATDSMIGETSGRKTIEFARSSRGETGSVALDTHMVKLMSPENGEFRVSEKTKKSIAATVVANDREALGKLLQAQQDLVQNASAAPVYNAYKALVKKAALELGWAPHEVMEAAWAAIIGVQVLKTRVNPVTKKKFTSEEMIDNLSNLTAGSGWNLAQVMTSENMLNEYRRLGVPESTLQSVRLGVETAFPYESAEPEHISVGNRAAFSSAVRRIPANPRTGPNVNITLPTGEKISRYSLDDELEFFAQDPGNPGVMAAFRVPAGVASKIAIDGHQPEDSLHLTLVYFGKYNDIGGEKTLDLIKGVMQAFSENYYTLDGHVTGVGRFAATPTSDGKDVIHALIDLPRLPEFRADFCGIMEMAGVEYSKKHGYIPHITLAYVDNGDGVSTSHIGLIPVKFNSVCLYCGDDVTEYKLG